MLGDPKVKASGILGNYLDERNDLLLRVTQLLQSDARVSAALLFGSLGRGDADSLSDIDVWIAVDDDHVKKVVAEKRQSTMKVGSPLLFFESPERAPEKGGYLMVYYDAPTAPHQVDWYWQPRSLAIIPTQTRLLFDRAGLPRGTQPIHFPWLSPVEELVQQPVHFVSSFWVALFATAKYLARSETEIDKILFPFLLGNLSQTYQYLNINRLSFLSDDYNKVSSPGERLQILRHLADDMLAMMVQLVLIGEEVPGLFVNGAYRFLDLVETILDGK
jgi:Polymerase beta, Nucleotidyltransferase